MGLIIAQFFFCLIIFAGDGSAVTCAGCHDDNAISLLPSSHQNYALQNTNVCFDCHAGEQKTIGDKIHRLHAAESPDPMNDCFSCHAVTPEGMVVFPGKSVQICRSRMSVLKSHIRSSMSAGSNLLGQHHYQQGISCRECHADYLTEVLASNVQCVKCHGGYNEMIKKTEKSLYENNPHYAPHMPGLRCAACHRAHREFKDICTPCHEYGYRR